MTLRLRVAVPLAVAGAMLAGGAALTAARLATSRRDVAAEGERVVHRMLVQLQEILSAELAEDASSEAHHALVSTALDPQVVTLMLVDERDRVLLANRLAWRGRPGPEVAAYDPARAAGLRERGRPGPVIAVAGDRLLGYAAVSLGARPGDLRPSRLGCLFAEYDLGPQLAVARRAALGDAAGLAAVLVAVAAGLALVLHHAVTRKVERISAAFAGLAAGDAGARTGMGGADELGRLGAAFDALADRLADQQRALRERNEALRELNAGLERRVGERTAQLEAAYAELEGFSYSVSHDLRVPLRAIDGFSQLLLEDHHERLDAEGRRLLGVVRDSAVRMGRLIDDILAFSRTGRAALTLGAVDLAGLAREVAGELAGPEPRQGLELRIGALPPARGDRALLRQVFVNLIGNALKFTRGRTPAVVEVGGELRGGRCVCWVRDNGAGFDPRFAERLFGVFQRLHRSDEFEGTGIGLAIVKRVIERHGGTVRGEGRVGEGATFTFELPGREDGDG